MPVLGLPEPPNWPAGRRRAWLLMVAAVVLFAPIVGYAVWALLRGHYLTAVTAVGIVAWPLIMVGYLLLVLAGRTSVRATCAAAGTTLRPGGALAAAMGLGLACFLPAGIAYLVFVPSGQILVPLTQGWRFLSLIAMGLAVGLAIWTVFVFWRRRAIGTGVVRLTPTGVDVTTAVSTESAVWDDVVDVKDGTEGKKTRTAIVLCRVDGSELVLDGADFYVPKGVGLYWMVHHYWRHPEDRAELADGRGLDRLRDERFDVA